jgi:hypothetical protein
MRRSLPQFAQPLWPREESRFHQACHECERWLSDRADESRQCRECRNRVELFSETCSHCGAAHPTRIPIALAAVAGAALLGCLALAMLLV